MNRSCLLGLYSDPSSRISRLERAKEKLGKKAVAGLLLFLMLESYVAMSNQTEAKNTL